MILACTSLFSHAAEQSYSGIYPHLAYFNDEGECGTGAVVPWADRLWVITYGPHKPLGSSDKLYEITPDLELVVRPESVGGTPANRMIHKESNQLFIGPYIIDSSRNVRVIPPSVMYGRLTGNARHLKDPENKIYYATMEEALYEVDVHSLDVSTLYHDEQVKQTPKASLPGYHGKGLYSGQGRVIYANNGEHSKEARENPFVDSGVLAEWDGKEWNVILRNQFTEVTGPGGIYGNEHPESDPVWSIGWDAKSLILMVLDQGKWHRYRLPKSSHSYDGAHGWNTEWPRIRDIGEDTLLMTMHGMFWRFPKSFSSTQTQGIRPRSSYLKVIGDFCRWQDKVVLGCDDSAKAEFLNKRKAKGHIKGPQSQSNLWFVEPETLDELGSALGRGAIWLNEPVEAGAASDPFLVGGFEQRAVHLVTDEPATITLEADIKGDNTWTTLTRVNVHGYLWYPLKEEWSAEWIRFTSDKPLKKASAWIQLSNPYAQNKDALKKFEGLSRVGETSSVGGIVRAMDDNKRVLEFAAENESGKVGYYILDADMILKKADDAEWAAMQSRAGIPSRKGVLSEDEASVIYTDDTGQRFRLPKNPDYSPPGPLGWGRLCREVATERDLFNCHGTFFELPARNAGGFSKVRPVSTHNLRIRDFCSYRGLFILSGVNLDKTDGNPHIIRSEDGKAALWAGAIDDIWSLGKPTGSGGPWKESRVKAGDYSDPYLITGYDHKRLTIKTSEAATITAEIDISGMGDWQVFDKYKLNADGLMAKQFGKAFQAYWIRFVSDHDTTATAQLVYN
jgi:hypothetical protein